MKKILLNVLLLISITTFAQPIVSSATSFIAPGFFSPVYTATSTIGAGSAGASQTWNFSSIPFTYKGTLSVVNPAASPYATSYPAANGLFTITTSSITAYYYCDTSATRLDAITEGITTPGAGNDFSPNSEQLLQFPFYYQDSITDIFQKVGGSASLESLVYDAYGTLITPFNTFNNIVRIKALRPSGTVYYWYNLNPLFIVLTHNVTNNAYTTFNPSLAAIANFNVQNAAIQIYPNPAQNNFTIQTASNNKQTISIFDINGNLALSQTINGTTSINVNALSQGVYNINLTSGASTTNKRLVIVK